MCDIVGFPWYNLSTFSYNCLTETFKTIYVFILLHIKQQNLRKYPKIKNSMSNYFFELDLEKNLPKKEILKKEKTRRINRLRSDF